MGWYEDWLDDIEARKKAAMGGGGGAMSPPPAAPPSSGGWLTPLRRRFTAGMMGNWGQMFGPEANLPPVEESSVPLIGEPSNALVEGLGAFQGLLIDAPIKKLMGIPAEADFRASDLNQTNPAFNPAAIAEQWDALQNAISSGQAMGPQGKLMVEAVKAYRAGDVGTGNALMQKYRSAGGITGGAARTIAEFATDPTNPYSLGAKGMLLLPGMAEKGFKGAKATLDKYQAQGLSPEVLSEIPQAVVGAGMPAAIVGSRFVRRKPLKPAVQEAAEQARLDQATKNLYSETIAPIPADAPMAQRLPPNLGVVTPEVKGFLQRLYNATLTEGNVAIATGRGLTIRVPGEKGVTPVRQIVLLDDDVVTYPDGTQAKLTGKAEIYGDTVYVTKLGQADALRAPDAAGVKDRIIYQLSHELTHPTTTAARYGAQFPTGKSGHAEGLLRDDRLADFEQGMREFELAEELKKHTGLQAIAAELQQNQAFANAFQGPTLQSPIAGTYTGPNLAMITALRRYLPGGEKLPSPIGAWEAQAGSLFPSKLTERQRLERALTYPPKPAEVISPPPAAEQGVQPPMRLTPALGSASGAKAPSMLDESAAEKAGVGAIARRVNARAEEEAKIRNGIDEETGKASTTPWIDPRYVKIVETVEEPRPASSALLGRVVQGPLQEYLNYYRNRGSVTQKRNFDYMRVLEQLEAMFGAGQLNSTNLEKHGIWMGSLEPLYQVLDKQARRLGRGTPEAERILRRISRLRALAPRAFGASKLYRLRASGSATPTQAAKLATITANSKQRAEAAAKQDSATAMYEKGNLQKKDAEVKAKEAVTSVREAGSQTNFQSFLSAANIALEKTRQALETAHLLPVSKRKTLGNVGTGLSRTAMKLLRREAPQAKAEEGKIQPPPEEGKIQPPPEAAKIQPTPVVEDFFRSPKGKQAGAKAVSMEAEGPVPGRKVERRVRITDEALRRLKHYTHKVHERVTSPRIRRTHPSAAWGPKGIPEKVEPEGTSPAYSMVVDSYIRQAAAREDPNTWRPSVADFEDYLQEVLAEKTRAPKPGAPPKFGAQLDQLVSGVERLRTDKEALAQAKARIASMEAEGRDTSWRRGKGAISEPPLPENTGPSHLVTLHLKDAKGRPYTEEAWVTAKELWQLRKAGIVYDIPKRKEKPPAKEEVPAGEPDPDKARFLTGEAARMERPLSTESHPPGSLKEVKLVRGKYWPSGGGIPSTSKFVRVAKKLYSLASGRHKNLSRRMASNLKSATTEHPYRRQAAMVRRDRAAFGELGEAIRQMYARKGRQVEHADIDKMGFTLVTRDRIHRALTLAFAERRNKAGFVVPRLGDNPLHRFARLVRQIEGDTLAIEQGRRGEFGEDLYGEGAKQFDKYGRVRGAREYLLDWLDEINPNSLLKPILQSWKGRGLFPFRPRPSGPYPGRNWKVNWGRKWEIKNDKGEVTRVFNEPIRTPEEVTQILRDHYGVGISTKWLRDKLSPAVYTAGKSKAGGIQGKLSGGWSPIQVGIDFEKRMLELMEARADALANAGDQAGADKLMKTMLKLADRSILQQLGGDMSKAHPGPLKPTVEKRSGFSYPALDPRDVSKLGGGVPSSLNPNVPDVVRKRNKPSGMGRKEEDIDQAIVEALQEAIKAPALTKKDVELISKQEAQLKEKGKGMQLERVRTSKVGMSDKYRKRGEDSGRPWVGQHVLQSARLRQPGEKGYKYIEGLGDSVHGWSADKVRFVENGLKEGMEGIDRIIDRLHADGRLHTATEAAKIAKRHHGLEYRDLIDDLEGGTYAQEIDFNNEYVWNKNDYAALKQRFRDRLSQEWDLLQEEIREANVEAQRKGEERQEGLASERITRLSADTLSPATKEFLDNTRPNLPTVKERADWVRARMALGEIRQDEFTPALDYLARVRRDFEDFAASKPPKGWAKGKLSPLPRGKQAGAYATNMQLSSKDLNKAEKEVSNKADVKEERFKGPLATRVRELAESIGEASAMGKAIATGFDVSNPRRQTLILTMSQAADDIGRNIRSLGRERDPNSLRKNLANMLRAGWSKEYFEKSLEDMKSSQEYRIAQKSGMRFIEEATSERGGEWAGYKLYKSMMDNIKKHTPAWADKLDVIEMGRRAYDYYQNKSMLDAFTKGMYSIQAKKGADPIGRTDLVELAKVINDMASRTPLFGKPEVDKFANYVFFSGNMIRSRLNLIAHAIVPSIKDRRPGFGLYESPGVRQFARTTLLKAIGANLAAYEGVSILMRAFTDEEPTLELDARSSDFLKLRAGAFSYDGWGGFQQYMRTIAQIARGQKKEVSTGKIGSTSRGDVLAKFFRSKLAPTPAFLASTMAGRTMENKPVLNFGKDPIGWANQAAVEILTPLGFGDIQAIMKEKPEAAWLGALVLLGDSLQADRGGAASWLDQGDLTGVGPFKSNKGARRQWQLVQDELRKQHVTAPRPSNRVTLPSRNAYGQKEHYTLDPKETEAFEKEYMPIISSMLVKIITSEAYQKLPAEKRPRILTNRIHKLNEMFGATKRRRREVWTKWKDKQIKPSGAGAAEELVPIPGMPDVYSPFVESGERGR